MAVDFSALNWIEHILEGMHTSNLCLKLCLFPCAHYIQCHWCSNVHMLLLMWWGGLHGLRGQLEWSFQFHSHVNLLFIFLPPPLLTPLFWLAHPLGLAMQEIFRKYFKPLSLNITLSVLFLLNIAVPVLLFPNCRNGLDAFFIPCWSSVGHKKLERSHCAILTQPWTEFLARKSPGCSFMSWSQL